MCCFFRTIFRLASPAFFRLTNGTELMIGEGGGGNGVQHKKEKKKNDKDVDYDLSRRSEAIRFKSHGLI